MSISIINNNTVTYPTDVYYRYNIYLINEYEKFLKNTTNEGVIVRVKNIIGELQELLSENITDGNPDLSLPVTKIFNVMNWEENLFKHFELLDASLKYINEKSISPIEMFLRKAKLEKLNNIYDKSHHIHAQTFG